MYIVHCTTVHDVNNICFTRWESSLYNVHCTMYIVQCSTYTMPIALCIVYTVQCTFYIVQYSIYTMYIVQCSTCTMYMCTVVQCTTHNLNFTLNILNSALYKV